MHSTKATRWFARTTFNLWQALGLHVVPNHYYAPVPDTRELPEAQWRTRHEAAGINLRLEEQLALAEQLKRYRDEFDGLVAQEATPGKFYIGNPSLTPLDAVVYYSMLRLQKPKRVIEIGAGFSTILAAAALARNKKEGSEALLTVIEPYPPAWLTTLKGVSRHTVQPVQKVPFSVFAELAAGDFLFIDSSHVLKTGSDVQYELLELLPRLNKGVLVHFHDIFLPNEYPQSWIKKQKRFWTEQYGLQAFLACNEKFRVRWAGNFLQRTKPQAVQALTRFATATEQPGSFWIERVA